MMLHKQQCSRILIQKINNSLNYNFHIEFTNQVINAKSAWSLTLSNDVEDNNSGLVTLYVNGVKYGAVSSVSSNTVNFNVLGFDIEDSDLLEVHYVKKHSVA